MKTKLILIAVAGVVLGTLAIAPPAEAGHLDWSFGLGFHVGGLHFRVGFSPPGYGGYPGPFFLTNSSLHYPGYSCNGACFRRGAGYYHHESCPLLSFHFRAGGYGPNYYVQHYSPYRGYVPGYGRYPSRPYRNYYRNGYRDRYRSYGNRHYRGDRHGRERYYRDRRPKGHRDRGYRNDRGRGRDYDRHRDGDRRRSYQGDRGHRGGGERDRAQPRRGAHRTRPPS